MTVQDLKDNKLIIFECISGSRAYGLDTPESDTDIRGVFMLPQEDVYGLNNVEQVGDKKNDIVYYELGRFIHLLVKNNPNIIEMLGTPDDKILTKHPVFERITPDIFLSKQCRDTFGGYAFTQVRKARGLNKKIVNPVGERRKSILEFCYVQHGQGSLSLLKWLEKRGFRQEDCGLVNIPHFKDTYSIFHSTDEAVVYRGIAKKDASTKVVLSSVPKEEMPVATMHFNEDGYVKYCKDYREYWDWVDKRNNARYTMNVKHGKNYDSKNLMHTFRLLDMAIEILTEAKVIVKRPNREELMSIRRGEHDYDELINRAEIKMNEVDAAWENSPLPDKPDREVANQLLIDMRREYYG